MSDAWITDEMVVAFAKGAEMTDSKLKACPECGLSGYLHIFQYESGWHNVECVMCDYLGPVEGSRHQAIKSYN